MSAGILPEGAAQRLAARVAELYERSFGPISRGPDHVRQMVRDSLDERRSAEQIECLVRATGIELRGKRILEIGAGIGLTVAMLRRRFGAEAYGIEPEADDYRGTLAIARDLAQACGIPSETIIDGAGEHIPFDSGFFDVVLSSNVLEHVVDPPRVIAEIARVLKPGGYMHIIVPNYGSWWEGHYGLLWLPHLPKWAGRFYVRALGRDPAFVDTLQFVTRGRLERWLAPHRARLDVLGWGEDLWEERVRGLGFADYAALGRLKRIVKALHALRLVPLVVRIGRLLHWETPIVLTARMRSP
ncbi:MAG TPA: class I SAM-dependent methyltransferase [Stellaceae bacterium]|nr:class I SAM-dependent methyltransferase [Stellaceae bacterium]